MAQAEGESSIVGSVLDGPYRVDRIIGAGGFGMVYEGRHLRNQKTPFLMATDGGAALVASGKLADAAFVSEVLAGFASPPALVAN